jgi:transposase InsO family protein
VHDDLVQRHFRAAGLDEVWLTDITEHPTLEGRLYVCAIKDACSNRIVGYSIDSRMTAQLAVNALRSAIARRQPAGTVVVHSDRGSQFRSRAFRAVLTAAGLQGSMGRVASAGDNAAMESFHSLLEKNVLNRKRWRTRAELRYPIITWIEQHLQPSPPAASPRQVHPPSSSNSPSPARRRWQHDQSQPPSTKLAADPSVRCSARAGMCLIDCPPRRGG